MSLIAEILRHNHQFVERREYEAFRTDAVPTKKLVIVTCMDTRLVELLPRAMNVRNGDVKMIKVAGAVVAHPFGSVMRSILVAVYALDAREIAVIGHHGCGMTGLNPSVILAKARARGVTDDTVRALNASGIDLNTWLTGFASVEEGVRSSLALIRNHPLLPGGLPIHGLIMSPDTGALEWIHDGYPAGHPAGSGSPTGDPAS